MKRTLKKVIALVMSAAIVSSFGFAASAKTFPDVPTTHWAYDTINTLTEQGIFKGYTDGSFRPDGMITHEEFTTAVINYVCDKLGQEVEPVGEDYEQYVTDDKGDERYWSNHWTAWAQPYLNKAVELGIIGTTGEYTEQIRGYYTNAFPKGYAPKTYYPDGTSSEAFDPREELNFGDSMQGVERDILNDTPITREEAARLITRAVFITEPELGEKLNSYPINDTDVFWGALLVVPDWCWVSPDYRTDVAALYYTGIVEGDESYLFNPQDNLTRAEASAIMNKLTNKELRRNIVDAKNEMGETLRQTEYEARNIRYGDLYGSQSSAIYNVREIDCPDGLMNFLIEYITAYEMAEGWWSDNDYNKLCDTVANIEDVVETGSCTRLSIEGEPIYYSHYLPMLQSLKDKIDSGTIMAIPYC